MQVVYADAHLDHAPPHQFNVDRMGPYSESPDRALRILNALSGDHDVVSPSVDAGKAIRQIHDADYLAFLETVYTAWEARGGTPDGLIPYTFASRRMAHLPADVVDRVGHFCFDAQTPIVAGTGRAARASADCAVTAAETVRSGAACAYALCRPPGHHACRDLYGGYCYLNNAAIAAAHLGGRVAIVDVDYHHGNGTQDIFYDRDDVLTVSLHADPDRAYPFFSGGADEVGAGPGAGHNRNVPLPPAVDDDAYLQVLAAVGAFIRRFSPDFLVVSVGFDTYREDPLGDFHVSIDGFRRIGSALRALDRPTVLIQEGGYDTAALGRCAASFLTGFE